MKSLLILCGEVIIDNRLPIKGLPNECKDLLEDLNGYKSEGFLENLIIKGSKYPFEMYYPYYKCKNDVEESIMMLNFAMKYNKIEIVFFIVREINYCINQLMLLEWAFRNKHILFIKWYIKKYKIPKKTLI
ncbi:MAG: hypothetical protein KC414_14345, partial [Romboutsia sp.]|nr:hypothetical protein [Romboutsia sp.]